ncbi:hypothetical protein PEP31012_04451 [Pandoraea eparura]|uniref:Uncharacterized protein n=1 Tax=Pandoraea eparura TaxID=2508291 RepID=A0A5E4YD08_9BURK|nr:hypothetical protein PEP31012_04451 [Pandoraea eparura]
MQRLTVSDIQRLQRFLGAFQLLRKRKRIGLDRLDLGLTRQESREFTHFRGSHLFARSDNGIRTFLDFFEILDAHPVDMRQRLSIDSNIGQFEHLISYRRNLFKLLIPFFQNFNLQNFLDLFRTR